MVPPRTRDEDARPEGLAARVLEDDVRVPAAGQLADPCAEALPLGGVLDALVRPEPVSLSGADGTVDDELRPHPSAEVGLVRRRDDTDRSRAAGEGQLGRVGAEPAARPQDEDDVAELHRGTVARDELPVCRAVDQPGAGGLLPRQVPGLGHELVGLDDGQLRQTAEVRLEDPDPLLRVEHRVVVAVGALELDGEAVGDDLLAGFPQTHPWAGPQDDAGQVRPDHVVGQVVALGIRGGAAVALEEPEGRHRLEDRGPHGVVVDRARHDGVEGLSRCEIRHGFVVDVQGPARVLVPAVQACEQVDLVPVDGDCAVGLGTAGPEQVWRVRSPDRIASRISCITRNPQPSRVERLLAAPNLLARHGSPEGRETPVTR